MRKIFILTILGLVCLGIVIVEASEMLPESSTRQVSTLVTYPVPAYARSSQTYAVKVNGQSLFVEKYNSISLVRFAFAGKADLEITVSEKIDRYTLSPKSDRINSQKNDKKIAFSIVVPRKLILHRVNFLNEKLFIIAEPLEENSIRANDANVINIMDYRVDNTGTEDATVLIQRAIASVADRKGILYFPPGIYKIKQLDLKSNLTLYLAGGAVLKATEEINPSYGLGLLYLKDVNNVKILGRGIIDGNGSYWRDRGGWYSLLELANAKNIEIRDILLLDPAVANVIFSYCDNVLVDNVKILADPVDYMNTDGFIFWSSRNITVDDALYKGTDDATSIGGDRQGAITNTENINVKNSVIYGGNGFKIGSGAAQYLVSQITYENIDVVYAYSLSAFWPVTGANFEKIYFKNIRVEDILDRPQPDKSADLFQWRVMVADWEPTSSPERLGYIRDVYVKDLVVSDRGGANSTFEGYDLQKNIGNVVFDNLYVEGKLALTPADAYFDIVNKYVDLQFISEKSNTVNIEAIEPYTSASKAPGLFRVKRTGDLSKDLTLNYIIKGTAKNGSDYRTISRSVTIPAGTDTAEIAIYPQNDRSHPPDKIKTVLLRLDNLPHRTDYLLGNNFQAAVNILNR